jgi:hypothetical protein
MPIIIIIAVITAAAFLFGAILSLLIVFFLNTGGISGYRIKLHRIPAPGYFQDFEAEKSDEVPLPFVSLRGWRKTWINIGYYGDA